MKGKLSRPYASCSIRNNRVGIPLPVSHIFSQFPIRNSQFAIPSCILYLAFLLLLACAVRPGPVQVTVEPVVEWTAPGDVAELRWTGRGWAAWLPAEGAVVYWPSDAPKDASPVRWSDERWQAPRAWAVTDGTVWLATPTELLAFSEGSSSPSTRMAWPEGATVWDDGRRLWVGHTSDDVRICTPGVEPGTPECWSFPEKAVRPDFELPAWTWSPPWWCGLRVGASDAGKARPAEVLCQRGVRAGLPSRATDWGRSQVLGAGARGNDQGPRWGLSGYEGFRVIPTASLLETLKARPQSPVFSWMNTVFKCVNTWGERTDPERVSPNEKSGRWDPERHGFCKEGSDVPLTGGGCARRDVRCGGGPYAGNLCAGGWAASTLRWWASVSAVAAGEGPRAKGGRLPEFLDPWNSPFHKVRPKEGSPLQESPRMQPVQGLVGGGTPAPLAWRRSFQIPAGADVTVLRVWIASTRVFVSTGRWAWLWDLERGRLRWRLDLGASVTVPPVWTTRDVLVVATRGLLLYALDTRHGDRLWVLPLQAPVTRMLLLQDTGCEMRDTGCEGKGDTSAGTSAWVALTLMDAPPMIVDVATGKTLWQATDWTAWDAAGGDDATVAWAGADRKIRVFRIRPQPTVRGPVRP